MTHTEALQKALEALHRISAGLDCRRMIRERPAMTGPLRASLLEKSMSDEQVIELASDVWEEVVMGAEPRFPGTTVFECSPSEVDP
jgi:hypothetical protein